MNKSTTSSKPALPRIIPSDTETEDLIKFGELRWPPEQIAAFFGWSLTALNIELGIEDSPVRKALLKGELQAAFAIESKLMQDAKTGITSSTKALSDLVRDRSFKLSKLDIFGGAEDAMIFEKVQQLIDKGMPTDFSEKEELYIEALQMVYSFQLRFGDRKTIKLLTKQPFGLTYDRAKDMIAEAIELFNGGRRNSKEAMRYHIAESLDTLYHLTVESAKTPQDYAIAAGILERKAKMLQLDQPEAEKTPPENYPRKFIISSLDPEIIGLPPVNRDELAAQIDNLEVPDTVKERLRREAGIKDMDIIKALDYAQPEES